MNHFIVRREVIKDTKVPRAINIYCDNVKFGIECSSTKLAPKIVGIPKRKEKDTICERGIFIKVPPIRVAPLLETPGIKAKICVHPIKKACLYEISFKSKFSSIGFKNKNTIPPTIKVKPIIQVLAKSLETSEWINKPTTAVGINPTTTLGIKERLFQTVFQKKIIPATPANEK